MTAYDVNELLLKLVEEPYENLVRAVKQLSNEINDAMLELLGVKGEDKNYLFIYYGNSLIADNKLTDLERKFIIDVTNFAEESLDEIFRVFKENKIENMKYAKKIFSLLSLDIRSKIIVYCTCFLAVDKMTSIDEVEFIQELLEGD